MDHQVANRFYNSAGVCSRTDPDCAESRFVVDRIWPQLQRTIKPKMRVLDLGCNAGRIGFAVEELGAIPVGIDCAEVPLRHAEKVAKGRNSSACFIKGDYTALPFSKNSFDAALLINNIVECSYEDIDAMLCQLQRILSPGGLFCLCMSDHLEQHQKSKADLKGYEPSTGKYEHAYDIPDHGSLPYHTYFWTICFAKFICSRYLTLIEEEKIAAEKYWLVFRKQG